MASLPSILNASYWQYKDDTSYVLKWIDQTAKTCGWKRQQTEQTVPAKSFSSKLRGKGRQAAKKKAAAAAMKRKKRDEDERGIVLSALEILEQANLISTCPPSDATRPPSSVIHALGRAIKLRKRFTDSFEVTRPDDQKSNAAHHSFVKVLEKIADLLLQATGKTIVNLDEANTRHVNSGASRAGNQNRYDSLLEQATQDEPNSSQAQSTKSSEPAIKEVATTSSPAYHVEVEDSQENAFMVFTLFTDLQEVKAEMKRLWEECFKDGADMVIATILTGQALSFVQRSEERLLSALDDTIQQEGDSEQGFRNSAWSFPGTYCRMLSILRDPHDVQAVLRFEDSTHNTGDKGEAINMIDLTFAFSARRLGSVRTPGRVKSSDPLLLKFEHNPRALLNSPNISRVLERDRTLCCILHELESLGSIHARQGILLRKKEDSITKDPIVGSLQSVWARMEVNLTSVFAAEVLLDIKEICNAFPAARPSYHDTCNSFMNLLGLKRQGEDALIFPKQESVLLTGVSGTNAWENKLAHMLTKINTMLPLHNTKENNNDDEFRSPAGALSGFDWAAMDIPCQGDFDVDCKKSLELYTSLDPHGLDYGREEYRQSRLVKYIWFPRNVNYLLDNYPIFTVFRQAFMETMTESIGIEALNANRHGLGIMAYLYNASRQLRLGKLHWPAMDRLIDLHKVVLFAGEVPTTPAAMLKSFSYRFWGPKGKMALKEKWRRMDRAIKLMKLSTMAEAYDEHHETAGRIPFWYTLESNALAAAAEKKAGKKGSAFKNAGFIENIPVMEEYLAKQLQDVRVDYLEIHSVLVDLSPVLQKHAREVFGQQANRVLKKEEEDTWSGFDFVSEAFEQEAGLHEAMSKCEGDPSKLPVQDCDYLQDSINCLADALRAKGIGKGQTSADGEPVNMPTSLTRFRIRGSDDLPDMRRLVLVGYCDCCHRKQYY